MTNPEILNILGDLNFFTACPALRFLPFLLTKSGKNSQEMLTSAKDCKTSSKLQKALLDLAYKQHCLSSHCYGGDIYHHAVTEHNGQSLNSNFQVLIASITSDLLVTLYYEFGPLFCRHKPSK